MIYNSSEITEKNAKKLERYILQMKANQVKSCHLWQFIYMDNHC